MLSIISREIKYIHHSLNIHSAEKAVADEVSAEAVIDIEIKALLWSGPAGTVEDVVGVYCKTDSDAVRFERAFEQRRWEDSKTLQNE